MLVVGCDLGGCDEGTIKLWDTKVGSQYRKQQRGFVSEATNSWNVQCATEFCFLTHENEEIGFHRCYEGMLVQGKSVLHTV